MDTIRMIRPAGTHGAIGGIRVERVGGRGLARSMEEESTACPRRSPSAQMSRRTFLERERARGRRPGRDARSRPSAAHASSKRDASAGARTAAQDAGATSDFGVALPADAAPKEFQFVQTAQPSSGLGWKAMDPLESIYSSFPGYANLGEPLVRVDKDWQVLPGQATDVGGGRRRHVLDVRPPAGSHVDQRRRGHGGRLRRVVPVRGGSRARLGLHLVLRRHHPQLRPGGPRRGRDHRGRRQGRQGQVPGRVRDGAAHAVPARDAHLVGSRSMRRRSRSTAPASTTSTRRRPSRTGPTSSASSARTGAWSWSPTRPTPARSSR